MLLNLGMIGRIGHPHQCAKAQSVFGHVNAPVRPPTKRVDVNDRCGPHHIEFHEIDEGCSTGKVTGRRGRAAGRRTGRSHMDRSVGRRCTFVGEGAHGYSVLAVFIAVFACLTAATMLG